MRAVGTLTDPAALNKIKMPHWDIFILSWLENLSVSRTRDILDLLSLGKKIQDVLKSVSL